MRERDLSRALRLCAYLLRYLDDNGWMNFKLYFTLGLTAIFVVAQGVWIASRSNDHDKPAG